MSRGRRFARDCSAPDDDVAAALPQLAAPFSARGSNSPQRSDALSERSDASVTSKLAGLTPRSLPFTFGGTPKSKPGRRSKRARRSAASDSEGGSAGPSGSNPSAAEAEPGFSGDTMASLAMQRVLSGSLAAEGGARRVVAPTAGFSPSLSRPPTTPSRSQRAGRTSSAVSSRLRASNLGGGGSGTPLGPRTASRSRDLSGLSAMAELPGTPKAPQSRLAIGGLFSPPSASGGAQRTPSPSVGGADRPAPETYRVVLEATPGMTSAQLLASLRKSGIRPEQVQLQAVDGLGPSHAVSSPFSDSSDDYPART